MNVESRIFLFSIFVTRIIFSLEESTCLILKLTIPFKLYVADATEAIEVLKNYLGENKKGMSYIYICIYMYIYTKIIVWCEDEERSIPLQVERKVKVNTQGKDQLLLLSCCYSCRLAIFRQLTYQIYYTRI